VWWVGVGSGEESEEGGDLCRIGNSNCPSPIVWND
jgi:hypothetical protein